MFQSGDHRKKKPVSLLRTPVWVSAITLLVLVALSVPLLLVLQQYHADQVKKDFLGQVSRSLSEQIQKKMDIGDTLAVAYARNSVIRDALLFEERQPIIEEVKDINRLYSQATKFENIEAHVITADGRSLVKSFRLDSYNQNILDHDLVKRAVRTGRPTRGINIGGASNFFRVINIQPVLSPRGSNEVIGFVGISQGLKSVVEAFKDNGANYALFTPAGEEGGQRVFKMGKADYFQSSPLKSLVLKEGQVRQDRLNELDGHLLFTQPLVSYEGSMLAAHAVSIPIEQFQEKIWERSASTIYILLAILLSTVTVSVLLLVVIRRSVIQPLELFAGTIKKLLASKQYDTPVRIDSDDEIGRLSRQFNTLLQQTAELIDSLKYRQEAINRTLILSRTDLYGRIVEVNRQFEAISGYDAAELVGQVHSIVRHPDTPIDRYQLLWDTIRSGRIWEGQLKNRRKDGSAYYVKTHILPIEGRYGEVVEYLSIQEDVTRLVELKESLERAKEAAEEANQAKSQFLSSMSHELRTPLNAIIGFSQLLQMSDLNDTQSEQVQNIIQSGTHLLYLINDILELAKIESGQFVLQQEPVSLAHLVSESFTMVEEAARAKSLQLERPNPSELEYTVRADYVRLKQALLNFLSNAIKYNREGGKVMLSVEPIEKDSVPWVRVHVRDTGLGISKEQMSRLFESFERLGYERSKIEGTGIGLSIARDLVEKMGGQTGVHSELGQGSDFWFELPLDASSRHDQS